MSVLRRIPGGRVYPFYKIFVTVGIENLQAFCNLVANCQSVYQSYISYKSLYVKNGPIKTYKVLYFCSFSILNLYFYRSNEENSSKHAL